MSESTGLGIVDKILKGGVETLSKTLVYGATGTGKKIACARFLNEGIKKGQNCLFVTTNETPENVLKKAKKLEIKMEGKGQLFFLTTKPTNLKNAKKASSKNLLEKITETVYKMGIERTAVESLDQVIKIKGSGMKKYKKLSEEMENLMIALGKKNTCIITINPQKMGEVEARMCEEYFQTIISIYSSKDKKKRMCIIEKSEKHPEAVDQEIEMDQDLTLYEVKKFFE